MEEINMEDEYHTVARIGEKVEDFTCPAYQAGQFTTVKLSQFQGKWVVLFFYPLDFTFVCPTEIKKFQELYPEFEAAGAVIVGASTDSQHSHKAWFERDLPEVKYPILADTNHHVSSLFDVLKDDEGIAYRGTFIIDPEGVLRYVVVSDLAVGRSVPETLRALKALQTGELCPVDWSEGQSTLGKA